MKFWKVFGLLALVLSLGMFSLACGGDDDDDDDNDDDQTPCEKALTYYLEECGGSFYAQDPEQGIATCETGEETNVYEAGIWECVLDAYDDCIAAPDEPDCTCYQSDVADCRSEFAKPM